MPIKPASPFPPGFPIRCLVRQKLLFLTINHVLAREQIRIQGRPPFRSHDHLVPQNHAQVEGNAEITRQEVDVVEILAVFTAVVVHEDVKIFEDGDDDAEDEGEVSAEETEGSGVCQFGWGDVLSASGANEADVRDEN